MDQQTRHSPPARRRERKTVYADSRWKPIFILQAIPANVNIDTTKEQERKNNDL